MKSADLLARAQSGIGLLAGEGAFYFSGEEAL